MVDTSLPDGGEARARRERLAEHREEPACAGCHDIIDPVGLAFEHFDALGRYVELDQGQPIDASGELRSTDQDGPVYGAAELSERLASSDEVAMCQAEKWFRFVYGGEPYAGGVLPPRAAPGRWLDRGPPDRARDSGGVRSPWGGRR